MQLLEVNLVKAGRKYESFYGLIIVDERLHVQFTSLLSSVVCVS